MHINNKCGEIRRGKSDNRGRRRVGGEALKEKWRILTS
jgi:hypothetical protein